MDRQPPSEQSIFLVASQIASARERNAYLQHVCGDDGELLASVEALLRADQQSADVLAAAGQASATEPMPLLADSAGSTVGPYKLLEKIGEGGMGVVYMAEQREPVRRRVALKIIKPGMDTKLVIARFEAERQALAMMDHLNIARVLDAGETESGLPFFVMELVKGIPINEFCDANRLDLPQRLALFRQVCNAIHHSHQKGIIHRDIKPSNVMVCNYDGEPVVKVIDFGVAKATHQQLTEKTLYTQHGQVVGTLEYMSPEQAELSQLDIDTRGDIYALGVLLYELLTGSTPLTREQIRSTAFIDVLRIICEEEPERPSTRLTRNTAATNGVPIDRGVDPRKLSAELRGELDWIILRALEKDRTRRYETVNSLSLDVQRYLANEPITARPPTPWYRMRKFTRRHPVGVARGCVALMILMIVAGFAWWNQNALNQVHIKFEKRLAILSAIQGNVGQALQHANEADRYGAERSWLPMIAGIVELYRDQGSSRRAVREFEEARRHAPDDASIKGLLATAFVWQGRWAKHEKMLREVKAIELEDGDIDGHFFIGQAQMWTKPRNAVEHLEYASSQWGDPPVVRMMLAEALGHLAWNTNDEAAALRAVELSKSARDELEDNVSAFAVSNWCHLVAATLQIARNEDATSLLDETAEANISFLSKQDDYLVGFPCRAWYHHLRDENEIATELWRKAVEDKGAKGWFASCYAAEKYRCRKTTEALELVRGDNEDPVCQMARVFLLADSPTNENLKTADEICETLKDVATSERCAQAQLLMRLRLGKIDAARQLARRLARGEQTPNAYQVITGDVAAEDLFAGAFDTRREELNARLLVAVYQMALGKTENGIATLEPAVAFGGQMVVADPAHWARALYERPFSPAANE